jgi:ACS family sodium-dependent inorganic phosphate cotransporter
MALCNVDRALLSVAGVPIAAELGLDSVMLGVLQSAYLWGYGLGQVPAGVLADRLGGPRVLLFGLALWSVATALLPLARHSPAPLLALVLARAVFGLGSAVALPATSATVSMLVPAARRASSLSAIYACFNLGSIVGLSVTPVLIAVRGWPFAFALFGVLGTVWAALASALLPASVRSGPAPSSSAAKGGAAMKLRAGAATQVLALVWVHCVIGWGFFLLLSWIPTFLSTQFAGFGDLRVVGLASSLPWLVSALVGLLAGGLADGLAERGWAGLRVRTAMHRVATLGPAAAIALLPLATSPASAVACLCLATGAQAFNFAGFHSHVAAVAGGQAGTLLALTNSGGIVMGIVGNILTGVLLQRFGSFTAVFAATACLYLSSFLVWTLCVRDGPLFVPA